ncbi:MAG: DNA translocase FtsK [Patescibacteria group bacterium]|jgi:S-DNA-T family DNA segregation ATPase FtsK/SpoIIIE
MTRYRQYQARPPKQENLLEADVSRGLISIILFIIGGLSILSFFSLAGVLGHFLDSLLAITFGQVRYVFPFILLIVGVLLIKDMEYSYRSTHLIGSVMFFLSFNGLVHLQKPLDKMVDLALQGEGGGLVGLALAWPLLTYVSYWGAAIILFGLWLASIIFIFNTSLARIVELNKKVFLMFGWIGKQIIAFFETFRKEKVKFAINGDYEKVLPKEVEEEKVEEEEREFARHKISAVENADEEETIEKEEEQIEEENSPQEKIVLSKPNSNYRLPPLGILQTSKSKPTSGDITANAEIIKNTLKNFDIEVEMGEVQVGPTVTQYSLKPYDGIKLSKITGLNSNLAMALAADTVRIEAPIPGKSLVGIEVPNQKKATVTLHELLESKEFKNRENKMTLPLGKDVAGKVNIVDLTKMPHLLVAGTTRSGKTVCMNIIISSLLFQNTPETLRFIMIDPKQVEFIPYNGIPHLLTPVIVEANKAVNALRWLITEMERRFSAIALSGTRDIEEFNKQSQETMPYLVLAVDEWAELMHQTAADAESSIVRLAQKGRAAGIHLVVATQRPSADVITGLMKANMPGRISFKLKSVIDSRTILDAAGADKLLGNGDMLYQTTDMSAPKRLQGAFITVNEIKDIVKFVRGDEPPQYNEAIVEKIGGGGTMNLFGGPSDAHDPMFEEAKNEVLESGKASATYLQRRLSIGYARAAKILDQLEDAGIVGPGIGAKPREVFTEHLMDAPPEEMPVNEQTLDSGGVVLTEPKSDSEEEKI